MKKIAILTGSLTLEEKNEMVSYLNVTGMTSDRIQMALNQTYDEDTLLMESFQKHGMHAAPIQWADPNINWEEFDGALIRTPWDYFPGKLTYFLATLAKIEASSCKLFNSQSLVRWNLNKKYLISFQDQGLNVVETYLLPKFKDPILIQKLSRNGTTEVIIKPTIGFGGVKMYKIPLTQLDEKIIELSKSEPDNEYLVQPFIKAIAEDGEYGFIYFNGRFSHAIKKKPGPKDFRVQASYGGSVEEYHPSQEMIEQAQVIFEKIPFKLLFARIDFVNVNNRLYLMEAELIHPTLYFKVVPHAIDSLVLATLEQLGG